MTKAQALEIFAQLAEAFRGTPQEHRMIQEAMRVLAPVPEQVDTVD